MRSFVVPLLTFFCLQFSNSSVAGTNTGIVVCNEIEKQALLSFKNGLQDPTNWLSSWIGDDCYTWKGVICNNRTGHVTKLNLRQPYYAEMVGNRLWSDEQVDAYMNSLLGGVISPSLLDLRQLKYLDLSVKNFSGIRIPEFLGSLKSLRYLNLSYANFAGMVPHQLGNLSNLRYLDLSFSTASSLYTSVSVDGTVLYGKSLQWLSNLSFLQYLDMSEVNLTNAIDYVQVLNVLPSLKELYLIRCELNPSLDFPASLVNFTSLTNIDLSENYFNSSVPEWLLSIRALVSLQLNKNYFHGPIPGGLQNMTSLRILQLCGNNFNSTLPDWLCNASNFMENTPELCGPPLTQKCIGDWSDNDIRRGVDKGGVSQNKGFYIGMAFGLVFGFWGVWGPLLLKKSWRHAYFEFLDKMIEKCLGYDK